MKQQLSIEIRRFKKIREDQGHTQQSFAKILGINGSTADIERGKTKITGFVVMELLHQFGINPLWLFGKSHEMDLSLNQTNLQP